ncbi:MAG TPA: heavy metal translocating P-type ATPase [Trebonia sp.]|nr:heavy metal translocating P-type ATPase [Trebonia sp.]
MRWAGIATVLFAIGLVARFAAGPAWLYWAFFLLCYAAGGWEPGLAGLRALREKTLDVDLLMVAAAIGAAAVGQVLDGGLLIVIFATSGALEAVATHRTAEAVRGLLGLAPERAVRLSADGGEEAVDAASLDAGDMILVRPGERIAADGEVLDGASDVDQASITGEPLPAAKLPGDDVFAGTLNGAGALKVRVGRAAADSVIARIVVMVEEASATKARTQLFIEKAEQRYSAGMVTATVLLFAIPLLAGEEFGVSLLRAMTFMIVASPCAVVLATMPALLAAMANAGRHGVLVKSAVALEEAADASVIAFDKTGTLTEGTPRLARVALLPGADPGEAGLREAGLREDEVLALAAAAENPSEHPLARAVVSAAREAGISVVPAESFRALPGRGVTAVVGGRRIEIGSPAHLARAGVGVATGIGLARSVGAVAGGAVAGDAVAEDGDFVAGRGAALGGVAVRLDAAGDDAVLAAVAEFEEDGQTAAVMRVDGAAVAVLGIADRIRPSAAAAVGRLTALTGAPPVLLTGDNERAATRLARQAGIADVRAGLLPADKVTAIRELQAGGRKVLLAGDGVNDAPAMATASTGVAMGRAGADLTLDTADVVIMGDDLPAIPAVISLARRARRVVAANLVIAGVIITGLVVWDLAGHLPLPLGVLGHEGSTVIVGLNGLRLLRKSAWGKAAG